MGLAFPTGEHLKESFGAGAALKNDMKKILIGLALILATLVVIFLWPAATVSVAPAPKVAAAKTVPRDAVRKEGAAPAVAQAMSPEEATANWKAFLDSGTVPEPIAGESHAVHHLVPVDRWKNVGRKSVGAAVQSQLWAIARADTDYLQATLVIDEAFKPAMQGLLEEVPESIRRQYPTTESLAAFLLASAPALRGYAIGNLHPEMAGSGEAAVNVATLEPGADRFRMDRLHRYRLTEDGEWTRVIGMQETTYWRQLIKWDKELAKSRLWSDAKTGPR